jgi:hypothetical protein
LSAGVILASLLFFNIVSLVQLEITGFRRSASALVARSAHIRDKANPHYQTRTLKSLKLSPKNGSFYRFDDSLETAVIAEEPVKLSNSIRDEVVFAFEFDNPTRPGLVPAKGRMKAHVQGGLLKISNDPSDVLVNTEKIKIPKEEIGEVVIRARADRGRRLIMTWSERENDARRNPEGVDNDLLADSKFRTYVINGAAMRSGFQWGDFIQRLMIQPSDAAGALVEIDYIRFLSKRAKYGKLPYGTGYEKIGGEMRRVLYMHPQSLQFSIRVPEDSPRLSLGAGVLVGREPLRFEVAISDSTKSETLIDWHHADSSAWKDGDVDLSNWAGKQAKVTLRVTGSGRNVALWSNPTIYSKPKEPFNVIVVVEDALRADHLGAYGYARPTSPVHDSIAENGVLFLNAIAQDTKTRPSISSMMTSLLPTATGVWDFKDRLRDEYLTLAEVLRSQGFETASFIQNGNAGPYAGLHQGFSHVFDPDLLGKSPEGVLGGTLFKWLERHRDRNFFAYVHVLDPHGPYEPPAPFDRWYREASSSGQTPVERSYLDPEWVRTPTIEGRRLLYDGEIRNVDERLKGLLEHCEKLGLREDTLFILTADHGEYLGEGGSWDHGPPGRWPVLHVPLIMSYPARFSEPVQVSEMVQLLDIKPTILELAGIDTVQLLLQGDSLVDLIEGRRTDYWATRICLSMEALFSSRQNPKPYGSIFFREMHVNNSPFNWPVKLPASLKIRVSDVGIGRNLSDAFLGTGPNLWVRYQFSGLLRDLFANTSAAGTKWKGKGEETYETDIEVLHQLRSLGYVH